MFRTSRKGISSRFRTTSLLSKTLSFFLYLLLGKLFVCNKFLHCLNKGCYCCSMLHVCKYCNFSSCRDCALRVPVVKVILGKGSGQLVWLWKGSGVPERLTNTDLRNRCSRITSTKFPSFSMTTFSSILTNLTALLPQSRDCSYCISRPILAPPQLWQQKHTDLRAHEFAHSSDLRHHSRLANITCAWSWRLCRINPTIHQGGQLLVKFPLFALLLLLLLLLHVLAVCQHGTLCVGPCFIHQLNPCGTLWRPRVLTYRVGPDIAYQGRFVCRVGDYMSRGSG
jgi:hypothetical protein